MDHAFQSKLFYTRDGPVEFPEGIGVTKEEGGYAVFVAGINAHRASREEP
jgi:hypothetical protein